MITQSETDREVESQTQAVIARQSESERQIESETHDEQGLNNQQQMREGLDTCR